MAGETRQPADHAALRADRVGWWLNMVEIFFGIITRWAVRRGNFTFAKDLSTAIGRFTGTCHDRCQPFTWTKDADELAGKIKPSRTNATRTSDSAAGLLRSDTVTPPCQPGAQTGGEYVTGYPLLRDAPDREALGGRRPPPAGQAHPLGSAVPRSPGARTDVISGTIGVRPMVWTRQSVTSDTSATTGGRARAHA